MSAKIEDRAALWREMQRSEIAHLDAKYGFGLAEDTSFGLELPYHSLGGRGFERLCYHLLVSEGKSPRFYGNPGQAQFGIDLIGSDGVKCHVYQCKNVAGFDSRALQDALNLFEEEWGAPDQGFPAAELFTICTTERITQRKEWDAVKTDFFDRTGVRVEEWDRTHFDTKLRALPDVVADVFGDLVADRFCDGQGWNDGLWVRLLPGLDHTVDRFMGLEAERKLILRDELIDAFDDILARSDTVLVEGPSGVGKSVAGLALAKTTGRRIMYIDIRPDLTADDLFSGITSRIARDTAFVLDNCHSNWDVVETATERVRRAMGRRPYTLIQIGQAAPKGAEMFNAGAVEYVAQLRDLNSSIRIEPDLELFRDVLRATLPTEDKVTNAQVETVYQLTLGNLAILELVLRSGIELDRSDTTIDTLAEDLATVWFGSAYPVAPALHAFASIAQFDLTIPAGISWPSDEANGYNAAINRFVLRQGGIPGHSGPTWRFTHAREAELVSRVLSIVSGQDPQAQAARHVSDHLIGLFKDIEAGQVALVQILQGRLSLSDEQALKTAILVTPEIKSFLQDNIEGISLQTFSLATLILHRAGAVAEFISLLSRKVQLVLEAPQTQQGGQIGLIGPALRTLGIVDTNELELVLSNVGVDQVLATIRKNGTLFELFMVLQYSTPGFAAGLIAALNEAIVGELIDKTIEAERSVGTLNFALRELAERKMPEGGSQLEALEGLLGGGPMLRLICENGTLFELFMVLKYSTPGFAAGLIAALDEAIVGELIDKTIEAGQSVGTLNLTFRELARRPWPDGRDQRRALESMISVSEFWRLISANGNLNDLAYLLDDVSREYRLKLFEPDAAPDVEQWRKLLGNGSFYSLARFIADALRHLPSAAIDAFETALTFEVHTLAFKSSWYELSTGMASMSSSKGQAMPESMEGAIAERAGGCALASVFGLDFQEACNAIGILWHYAPERHQEVADRIWDILPEPADWPRDYKLLSVGALLFPIISEEDISVGNAQRVMEIFWPALPLEAVETASGNVMSSFLWRLQGLLEARNRQHGFPKTQALPEDAKAALLRRLDTLAKTAKLKEDKLGVLRFAGAIAYYWPKLRPDIDAAVRGNVRGFRFLLDEALTLTFVPAVLVSIGLTFVGPERLVFSTERTAKLAKLLEDWDYISDQVHTLETFVLRKARAAR